MYYKQDVEEFIDQATLFFIFLNLVLLLGTLIMWELLSFVLVAIETLVVLYFVVKGQRSYGKTKVL